MSQRYEFRPGISDQTHYTEPSTQYVSYYDSDDPPPTGTAFAVEQTFEAPDTPHFTEVDFTDGFYTGAIVWAQAPWKIPPDNTPPALLQDRKISYGWGINMSNVWDTYLSFQSSVIISPYSSDRDIPTISVNLAHSTSVPADVSTIDLPGRMWTPGNNFSNSYPHSFNINERIYMHDYQGFEEPGYLFIWVTLYHPGGFSTFQSFRNRFWLNLSNSNYSFPIVKNNFG